MTEAEHRLRERVKELNCLYGLSQLVEARPHDLDAILQGITELIPPSWQYPEAASAEVVFKGRVYRTERFRKTRWIQTADIHCDSAKVGTLSVAYRKHLPVADDGPFLAEERALINELAERLGHIAERLDRDAALQLAHRQLKAERNALEETNAALRVVLSRFEEDQRALREEIVANLRRVLSPTIEMLEAEIPSNLQGYLELLKRGIEEITSPFIDRVSAEFMNLSPTELIICNMIRVWISSKEIADLRHISLVTVARHREHIRRKLGLTNTKANLSTYLQTMEGRRDTGGQKEPKEGA